MSLQGLFKAIKNSPLFLPAVLITVVLFVGFCGNSLSLTTIQVLYTLSSVIKSLLMFFLPFMVFSLLFNSVMQLQGSAVRWIIILLPMILILNYVTLWLGYFSGTQAAQVLPVIKTIAVKKQGVLPLFNLYLPTLSSKYALMLALVVSFVALRINSTSATRVSARLAATSHLILQKFFIPLLPLLMLGFLLKMQADGMLSQVSGRYSAIFIMVAAVQIIYVILLYGVVTKFKLHKWLLCMQTMLPAALSGFCTMSSAAAMPLSLLATEKNTGDKDLTNFIVPSTVNFNLLGDSIVIPMLTMAIMTAFSLPLPTAAEYAFVALLMLIAKFSVAAVPGAGILVVWPILHQYLSCNDEVLALIQAIYILFDGINTFTNIMANGAFALMFKKVVTCKKNRAALYLNT